MGATAYSLHASNSSRSALSDPHDVIITSIRCGPPFSDVIARDVMPHIKNYSVADDVASSDEQKNAADVSGYKMADLLWMFVGPIIFTLGLCGNAMILLVMTRRRMRGTSTCVYLTLMALADSMVLVTGMVSEWLEAGRFIALKEIHPAVCKLEKFLFYTSGDTAVWILVIFTVDRFIAVCFPLKKNNFCRSSRAKIYSLVALLAAAAKNAHVFWTRGYELIPPLTINGTARPTNCGRPTPEFKYFEQYVRPWIAFSLINALPFAVILLCNVFIVRALLKVRRLRSEHSIVSTSDKSLVQMTAMCLSASFCFLVLVTPSIVLVIGRPAWSVGDSKRVYELAKAINNQLFYVNHSINFVLYCVTGRRFREVIVRLCCCSRGPSDGSETDLSRTTATACRQAGGASPESARKLGTRYSLAYYGRGMEAARLKQGGVGGERGDGARRVSAPLIVSSRVHVHSLQALESRL